MAWRKQGLATNRRQAPHRSSAGLQPNNIWRSTSHLPWCGTAVAPAPGEEGAWGEAVAAEVLVEKGEVPARGVPETVPRGRIIWGAGIRVCEDGSIGAEDRRACDGAPQTQIRTSTIGISEGSRSGIDLEIGEHIGEICGGFFGEECAAVGRAPASDHHIRPHLLCLKEEQGMAGVHF